MKSLINLSLIFLLSACSMKFDVQKRRYNKGLHWSFAGKKNQNTKQHFAFEKNINYQETTPSEIAAPMVTTIENTSNVDTKNTASVKFVKHSHKIVFNQSSLSQKSTGSNLIQKRNVLRKFSSAPDKEKRVPGTVLFILVCVLAGLFTVAGIGYLILFLSTSAFAYLIFAAISAGLAALFFFIMNGMNQVE